MKLVFALVAFGLIAVGCTKKEEVAAPAPEAAPAAVEAAPAVADTNTTSTTL